MAGSYTGKQRMEAAFKGQKLDRTPIFLFLGSHLALAEKAGFTVEQTLTDPEAALQTLKITLEILETDTVLVPYNPFQPTAQEALRKRAGKAGGSKRSDIKAKLPKWHVRRVDEDPLFMSHLDACQKTVDRFPDHHIETDIGGPWSFALELRGMMEALDDIYEDKGFLHDLMDYTTETLIVRGLAVSEMGITLHMGDPAAGMSVISPAVYREFVLPYHRRMVQALHADGARVVFHICGYGDKGCC